jgi:hypothetical protein
MTKTDILANQFLEYAKGLNAHVDLELAPFHKEQTKSAKKVMCHTTLNFVSR